MRGVLLALAIVGLAVAFALFVAPTAEPPDAQPSEPRLSPAASSERSPPPLAKILAAREKAAPGADGTRIGASDPSTADVREINLLWRDVGLFERLERQLGPEAYRSKVIGRTLAYLDLEGAAARTFEETTRQVVEDLVETRARMERDQAEFPYEPSDWGPATDPAAIQRYRDTETEFRQAIDTAVERIAAALGPTPRHELFREQIRRFVLYLVHRRRPVAGRLD